MCGCSCLAGAPHSICKAAGSWHCGQQPMGRPSPRHSPSCPVHTARLHTAPPPRPRGADQRHLRKAAPPGCSSDRFIPGVSGCLPSWRGPWPRPALPRPQPFVPSPLTRIPSAGCGPGRGRWGHRRPCPPCPCVVAPGTSLSWLEQEHNHNVPSLERYQQDRTGVPPPRDLHPRPLMSFSPWGHSLARLGVPVSDVGRRLTLRILAWLPPPVTRRGSSPSPVGRSVTSTVCLNGK